MSADVDPGFHLLENDHSGLSISILDWRHAGFICMSVHARWIVSDSVEANTLWYRLVRIGR